MTEEKLKNGFVFYRSYAEACRTLPEKQQLKLLWAIIDKGLDEIEPELSGTAKGMYTLIAPNLDANNARYNNGLKGAEAGKKGGRPKKCTLTDKVTSEPSANDSVREEKYVELYNRICGRLPAVKVLEGRYYSGVESNESSFDTDDFFSAAVSHAYGELSAL